MQMTCLKFTILLSVKNIVMICYWVTEMKTYMYFHVVQFVKLT